MISIWMKLHQNIINAWLYKLHNMLPKKKNAFKNCHKGNNVKIPCSGFQTQTCMPVFKA